MFIINVLPLKIIIINIYNNINIYYIFIINIININII